MLSHSPGRQFFLGASPLENFFQEHRHTCLLKSPFSSWHLIELGSSHVSLKTDPHWPLHPETGSGSLCSYSTWTEKWKAFCVMGTCWDCNFWRKKKVVLTSWLSPLNNAFGLCSQHSRRGHTSSSSVWGKKTWSWAKRHLLDWTQSHVTPKESEVSYYLGTKRGWILEIQFFKSQNNKTHS